MWDKIDMQDDEMLAYGEKIKTKGYMTLSDIIEIYFAFNEDLTNDENDSFNGKTLAIIGGVAGTLGAIYFRKNIGKHDKGSRWV